MALVLKDRVLETATTTGTGTLTLLGAVAGYQAFSAIGNGNTTFYTINNTAASEWEVGIGTYTSSGTTLARTTVLSSSNAGALVNFSAGTKNVWCDYPAEKSVNLDASGNVSLAGALSVTGLITGSTNYTGFKNRLINGDMKIAQRAISATVTAGTAVPTISAGYPCPDRWFIYCTGANVIVYQNQPLIELQGAASVTAIGIGQRIEAINGSDLVDTVCTLSARISNTLLTTVTWTVSYATTTPDTFGTIGTPTKTQIATGTFTVTNDSDIYYQASMTIPGVASALGIEVLFTVGAQTSGSWFIGDIQFEKGAVKTDFDIRDISRELQLCQRYYAKLGDNFAGEIICQGYAAAGNQFLHTVFIPAVMRISPTATKVGTWTVTNCGQPAVFGASMYCVVLRAYVTVTGSGLFYTIDDTTYLTCAAEIP